MEDDLERLRHEFERSNLVTKVKQAHGQIEAEVKRRRGPVAVSILLRLVAVKKQLDDTADLLDASLPPSKGKKGEPSDEDLRQWLTSAMESVEVAYMGVRDDFARSLFDNARDAESVALPITKGVTPIEKLHNFLTINSSVSQMAFFLMRYVVPDLGTQRDEEAQN